MVSAAEQLAANVNWSAFGKAEELKKRIWFTLGALIIYRFGTYIPLPGIDPAAFEANFTGNKQGVLELFNMFSGGAVQRMAIFALNIMPYISASIIIQLLTSVFPTLEALKKEGESGRKVINQYTRYLTVVLAAFQAYGIAVGLEESGGSRDRTGLVLPDFDGTDPHGRHHVPDVARRADHLSAASATAPPSSSSPASSPPSPMRSSIRWSLAVRARSRQASSSPCSPCRSASSPSSSSWSGRKGGF